MVGQHDLLCQFPFQNMPEICTFSPTFHCWHHLPRQLWTPEQSIQGSSTSLSKPGLHVSYVTTSHWHPLKALHAFSWPGKQNPDSSPGYRHHWVLSNTKTRSLTSPIHVFSHFFLTGRLSPTCCFPQACFLPLFQFYHPLSQLFFHSFITFQVCKLPLRFVCLAPVPSRSPPFQMKVLDFPGGAVIKNPLPMQDT